MSAFQGGDDSFISGEGDKDADDLLIVYCYVLGSPRLAKIAMFRSNAWVIETSRNRVGITDLTVLILKKIGFISAAAKPRLPCPRIPHNPPRNRITQDPHIL